MPDREHDDLLTTATDHFERRLVEECGALRTEMGQLRIDMVTQGAEIRTEVSKLRLDMVEQFGAIRLDAETRFGAVGTEFGAVRTEFAAVRTEFAVVRLEAEARHRELLKWALVFWVGQAASVAAIVSAFN